MGGLRAAAGKRPAAARGWIATGAVRFSWTPAETRRCRIGDLAELFAVTVADDAWPCFTADQALAAYEAELRRKGREQQRG